MIVSQTQSLQFFWYNSKKVKFIFCFGAKLIPTIWLTYFSIYLKSFYESYLSLSTLLIIFVFSHPIQNKFSSLTLQLLLLSLQVKTDHQCLFIYCITTVIKVWRWIVTINLFFILPIVWSNTTSTDFVSITSNKSSLLFVLKQN